MRIATEVQSEWANKVYSSPLSYTDIEIEIAYYILSGLPFEGKQLDKWAESVYNETMGRPRTTLDIAVAYDIFKERNDQGT